MHTNEIMQQLLSRIPLNDLGKSMARLDAILKRRRLTFNPYSVSDARLMEIVDLGTWGNELDITQIIKIHFTRLRPVHDIRKSDGIFMHVGTSTDDVFIPNGRFLYGISAYDTHHSVYTTAGSRQIRHYEDIEWLVGKVFFISHMICGIGYNSLPRVAYRMHRLYGKPSRDAAIVRKAICDAKIDMLQRILANPECELYLDCSPDLFDYKTRINRAIALIRQFPNTPIPTS